MKLTKGDKIELIKPMGVFRNIGELCEVVDVTEETISFRFGRMHLGVMSHDEAEKYFVKHEDKPVIKPVNISEIEKMIQSADLDVEKVFDRATIVTLKLPSGFIITESSSCIDERSYNKQLAIDNCKRRLVNRLAEMEGYHRMQSAYESRVNQS